MCFSHLQIVLSSILCMFVGAKSLAVQEGSFEPKRIVVTTAMVGDIVKGVAGDRAQVEVLMGEGVDPHLYKPKSSDVRAIVSADAVFYSGLFLEGRMASVLEKAANRGREVMAIAEVVPQGERLYPKNGSSHPDPHVWMDVALWSSTIASVTEGLCRVDPDGCDTYTKNAQEYLSELLTLEKYVRSIMATIPEQQRVLVTAHDAFGYFGRAYSINVRGIQGISTESEAGLADINRLVNFIVKNDIPAVFVESSVPKKNVRALIEGASAQGHQLLIGGELYSDAMGPPGTWEGTYPGMIDHNATTITRALGGTAPDGGYRVWKAQRSSEKKVRK